MKTEENDNQTNTDILDDNAKTQPKSDFIIKVRKDFLKKQFETDFAKFKKNTGKTLHMINNSKNNQNPKKKKKRLIKKKKKKKKIF
jgi:hypothetical protein